MNQTATKRSQIAGVELPREVWIILALRRSGDWAPMVASDDTGEPFLAYESEEKCLLGIDAHITFHEFERHELKPKRLM